MPSRPPDSPRITTAPARDDRDRAWLATLTVLYVEDDATTRALLDYGVRLVLVEKPGALARQEINEMAAMARERQAQVQIAYNRRWFASTLRAQEIIAQDGGVRSMHFEFGCR